MFLYLSL